MSYEVRDGEQFKIDMFDRMCKLEDGAYVPFAPTQKAVTDALGVLRAVWGPGALETEELTDMAGLTVLAKRIVARSPWRTVDGADDAPSE